MIAFGCLGRFDSSPLVSERISPYLSQFRWFLKSTMNSSAKKSLFSPSEVVFANTNYEKVLKNHHFFKDWAQIWWVNVCCHIRVDVCGFWSLQLIVCYKNLFSPSKVVSAKTSCFRCLVTALYCVLPPKAIYKYDWSR